MSVENLKSWASIVTILPSKLNIPNQLFDLTSLKEIYTDLWTSALKKSSEDGKLGLLGRLKNNFSIEPYVKVLPHRLRKFIAKVRVSAHSFEIETGRYKRPIIPRSERICKFCSSASVGDEKHVLLECELSQEERTHFLSSLNITNDANTYEDILIRMLNYEDKPSLMKTAHFIESIYQNRSLLVESTPSLFREPVVTRAGRISRPPDFF